MTIKKVKGKLKTVNFTKASVFSIGIFLLPFAIFLLPSRVSAQSLLSYPIPDLGYCRDAKECYLYCEIPENKAACWSYGNYVVGEKVLGLSTPTEDETRVMETKAKNFGITFPVAELGNCTSALECKTYCDNSDHQDICIAFAKKKGFHKKLEPSPEDETKREELVNQAKTELGCTSLESCHVLCEQNPVKCQEFARRHRPQRKPEEEAVDQEKQALIEKAKTELGCDSIESCRQKCEENKNVCMAFTRKYRPTKGPSDSISESSRGGTLRSFARPAGCTDEESCRNYCVQHPNECPGYQKTLEMRNQLPNTASGTPGFLGPSGCRNEQECRQWCQQYPEKCPGFQKALEYTKENQNRLLELQKTQEMQRNEMMKNRYELTPTGSLNSQKSVESRETPKVYQYLNSGSGKSQSPTTPEPSQGETP